MGIFDRIIGAVNRAGEAKEEAEQRVFGDRRFQQAERLAESGTRTEAVITGIRLRLNDTLTDVTLRLTWFDGAPRHAAIALGTGRLSGLRLGSTVAIRQDGDAAVLDWSAMAPTWCSPAEPGQRRDRKAPDEGIDDRALDMRVLKRLREPDRVRGVISGLSRVTVFGLPSENWDIEIRLPDGSARRSPKDAVPFYAHWFAAPGAEVPVALSGDSGAQIDWPALAEERAARGGLWTDRPPDGSIAALLLAGAASGSPATGATAAAANPAHPIVASPPATGPAQDVSLQQWAAVTAALMTAGVPPTQYDAFATAEFGLAEGAFTAADAEWQSRMRSDWQVGAALGQAIEDARKQQRKRR